MDLVRIYPISGKKRDFRVVSFFCVKFTRDKCSGSVNNMLLELKSRVGRYLSWKPFILFFYLFFPVFIKYAIYFNLSVFIYLFIKPYNISLYL